MPDFLDFKTSILNPALKLLVPALFLVSSVYLFRIWNRYQGVIGTVVRRLAIASVAGFLSNLFRWASDYWFKDFKWGESLFALAFALFCLYAAWPLLAFIFELKADAKK